MFEGLLSQLIELLSKVSHYVEKGSRLKDGGGEKMGKDNQHLCEWKKDEIKDNLNSRKSLESPSISV